MQLTKLEIKGFKSFADRVVINFDKGITSIVGPNGCGKSNVIDSIRWVLGEQKSRVLRSDKMENIIFNGAKARKPTQLAEVSLTFNNTKNLIPTEFSYITITRKYYRSGESEYVLNGVACRLKDITNLFLDTGIASNSYAIIELKMVDDLLNDKDNSRRLLFEGAAGISRFRIRKKETLKKLSDMDVDLERVEDLLFEIEKNLKSLERQASQTKKYYKLKDEYKKSSMALAKKVMVNQQENFDNIQQQIQEENDKKLALNTLVNEKKAAIEKAKAEFITKEKFLSSRQKTLNEYVGSIRKYESDKKIKNERQKFLNNKIEALKEQVSYDKQSNERTVISLQGFKFEAKGVEKEVTDILLKVDQLKIDHESQKKLATDTQEKLSLLNQYYSEKKDHQFQISKEIEIKDIQLSSMKNELNKTSDDSGKQSANFKKYKTRLAEIEKQRSKNQTQYDQIKDGEENLKEQIAETHEKINKTSEELAYINRTLDARQNEFSLTKSLVDNLEGFPETIKFLKKNPQWKDTPLLSDIISCPEKYHVCIENFLEPYMNYYIVDSANDALKAVNLLNESTRGKAYFFILNKLAHYSSENINTPYGSTPAMEVIDFDKKYENLVKYLLWNVFITENPSAPESNRVILLDKDGKITFGEFSISGGSIGLFEGKRIGRAKNLEMLETEIKNNKKLQSIAHKSLKKYKSQLQDLKLSSKISLLEQVKEQLSGLKEIEVSIQTKQDQFLDLLNANKNRRGDIHQQIVELEGVLETLRPKEKKLKDELVEMKNSVGTKKDEVFTHQEALEVKSTIYNEENVVFYQRQNKFNSILREISFKEELYEDSLRRIEKNKENLEEDIFNLNELIKKSTSSDEELIAMYEERQSLEAGINETEREYYEARGLINEDEKSLHETQNKREGIDNALMEWQKNLNESKINLNSVKDRLSLEFNISLENIWDEDIKDYKEFTEETLKSNVEKLKSKLKNSDPINPMAMEAFEEIKERHTFIIQQKEDLIKAKESLFTTISEINKVAKEAFMEAFQNIKDNFIKVFRALFTEKDDCDLILTNPDQPLESAIDIIAKPKGKKPLNINQLSGGEKTLTAISLLFSIYLIKPAPFCVFDEVDAPLDDANIDKFNEIIRKFSKDSQFIIVTHNKQTMINTDIIYGVTMQEQGVSKVVPIDLRELA